MNDNVIRSFNRRKESSMNEVGDKVETRPKGRTLEEGQWSDIVVIQPNGELVSYSCAPTLANLQALVGGYIEVVPGFNKIEDVSCLVLCDEEGRLRQAPVNTRATLEWAKCLNQSPYMLVGDIVVLSGKAKKEFER